MTISKIERNTVNETQTSKDIPTMRVTDRDKQAVR